MKKLRLTNKLSPDSVVMLTAAVPDLHLSHPGKLQAEMKTSGGAVREHDSHFHKLTHDLGT